MGVKWTAKCPSGFNSTTHSVTLNWHESGNSFSYNYSSPNRDLGKSEPFPIQIYLLLHVVMNTKTIVLIAALAVTALFAASTAKPRSPVQFEDKGLEEEDKGNNILIDVEYTYRYTRKVVLIKSFHLPRSLNIFGQAHFCPS